MRGVCCFGVLEFWRGGDDDVAANGFHPNSNRNSKPSQFGFTMCGVARWINERQVVHESARQNAKEKH